MYSVQLALLPLDTNEKRSDVIHLTFQAAYTHAEHCLPIESDVVSRWTFTRDMSLAFQSRAAKVRIFR